MFCLKTIAIIALISFGHPVLGEAYHEEIEFLACCVEAEAGNQDLDGKKLVVDVILNRVDDPDFPNTITEVITQRRQFTVVSNGSIYRVEPSDETFQAIQEELIDRVNYDVIYFSSAGYENGKPWMKVGDHYFSTK